VARAFPDRSLYLYRAADQRFFRLIADDRLHYRAHRAGFPGP
jgi:hypothetical protein